MTKCKYETSNGRCGMKDCYAYRHKCYTEEFCKCHQPQTKADRIRAMSDEELAEWMGANIDCMVCPVNTKCTVMAKSCEQKLLEWLKQPAE